MRLLSVFCALLLLNGPSVHAADMPEPEARYQPLPDTIGDDTAQQSGKVMNIPTPAMNGDVQDPDAASPEDQAMPMDQAPTSAPVTAMPAIPAPGGHTPPAGTGETDFDTVLLQGLNKVTARPQQLEASIGSVIRYGTIEIIAHKCWKSSPEDRPENAALLEVSEVKQGEAPQRIFSGWMFSSTPGISSLEHPFYDINVISCSKSAAKL